MELRQITPEQLKDILAKHFLWVRGGGGEQANLSGSDLRWSDLSGANLSGSDLSGANLDFSAFPLCCAGTQIKVDDRFVYQFIYHLTRQDHSACSSEVKAWLATIPTEILDGFMKYRKDLRPANLPPSPGDAGR